jgi:hypothetical protein
MQPRGAANRMPTKTRHQPMPLLVWGETDGRTNGRAPDLLSSYDVQDQQRQAGWLNRWMKPLVYRQPGQG